MRTRHLLICLALVLTSYETVYGTYGEGWISATRPLTIQRPVSQKTALRANAMMSPRSLTGNPCISEEITPEIQALARGLENDPKRIYDYVHDHIRFQYYFGSKKGAELTLLERSGNDFDQCALLVALLRAAGYSDIHYQFGTIQMPYDSADHRDFHHWIGTMLTNTVWTNTFNLANYILNSRGGYPLVENISGDTNSLVFHHVRVQFNLGDTNYLLDPSFKVSEPVPGVDLHALIGVNSNQLYSVAGGVCTGVSVSNLDEAAVRTELTGYTTGLLTELRNGFPNASVNDILGGCRIQSSKDHALGENTPWQAYDFNASLPMQTWDNIPTNYIATLTIAAGQGSLQFYMPELRGRRLGITMDSNTGWVGFWLDSELAFDGVIADTTADLMMQTTVHQPSGYWDTNANVFVDTGDFDQSAVRNYPWADTGYVSSANYVVLYAFDP
jgi:hypothetical protein